jgi:hypothetical protein
MRTRAMAARDERRPSVSNNDPLPRIKEFLQGLYRYLRGGEPVPAALNSMAEFLSGRGDLASDDWIAEATGDSIVGSEVAGFVYDFFVGCQISFGRVRSGDRMKDDLHFNQALQDDWDEYLADAFKARFNQNLSFTGAPRIETVGDLLIFLQRALDRKRSSSSV